MMSRVLLLVCAGLAGCFLSLSEPNEGASGGAGPGGDEGGGGSTGSGGGAPATERIYVIGGQTPGGTNSNAVFMTAVGPDGELSWETTASLPETLGIDYPGAIGLNGRLFVIGGTAGPNIDKVYWADPDPVTGQISAWTQAPSFSTARFRHAVASVGDELFIMGGKAGTPALKDVQRASFDPIDGVSAWAPMADLPAERHRLRAAGSSNHLYAVAGSTYDVVSMMDMGASDTIFVGEVAPGTTTWSTYTHASFESRYNAAAIVHDGRLYVTGGAFGSGASPRAEVAHAVLGAGGMPGPFTKELAPFGTPREAHGTVIARGRMYIVGGLAATGPVADCDVAVLDDGALEWTAAAPLPEGRGFHGTAALSFP